MYLGLHNKPHNYIVPPLALLRLGVGQVVPAVGGYQGWIFEEVDEGDDWCGAGGFGGEEVLSEVPGWVVEGDILEPAHIPWPN